MQRGLSAGYAALCLCTLIRAFTPGKLHDEETAHDSYMNPEPGFQSVPGDSAGADY